MNKPLTIFSGTYQKTIITKQPSCLVFTCNVSVTINSFWRVIIDDEDRAAILITQQPTKECSAETSICDEDRTVLQYYRVGGCTYTCSLSDKTVNLLRLPYLRIKGKLKIKYPRNEEQESEIISHSAVGESDADGQSSSSYVDISNFSEGATFAAAVFAADVATATIMQSEGAIDMGNGHSSADGTANDGNDGTGHNNDGNSGGPGEGGPSGE